MASITLMDASHLVEFFGLLMACLLYTSGFQRLLFLRLISEANASGLVSNQMTGFQIPESRQKVCSVERIKIVALVCKLQSTERTF